MHDTEALTETQVGPPQGIQVEQKSVRRAPPCTRTRAIKVRTRSLAMLCTTALSGTAYLFTYIGVVV